MRQLLKLRADETPERLVVLRMGVNTMSDQALIRACADTFGQWGILAFSVLELPGEADWEILAAAMPIVRMRPKVLMADSANLLADGFALLATGAQFHWSIVLSEATSVQFGRVRRHFTGPIDNPAWRGRAQ